MKPRQIFITSIVALISGTLLILLHKLVDAKLVVSLCGAFFLFAGLLHLCFDEKTRQKRDITSGSLKDVVSSFTGIAALIVGFVSIIFRKNLISVVPFLFGLLLLIAAIYQFCIVHKYSKRDILPVWLYFVASALALAAIFVCFQSPEEDNVVIMLTSGISIVVLGGFLLVEAAIAAARLKNANKSIN